MRTLVENILILLLIIPSAGYAQKPAILTQDYSFLVNDGEVSKLHQSNDTLFELSCSIDQPCQTAPVKRSKILSSMTTGEFTILRLEGIDSVPFSIDPYPTARYSILALKNVSKNSLGSLPLRTSLTKQQMDTVKIQPSTLRNKFFFTFYSESYLKELSGLRKVTTMEDAETIVGIMNSDKFKDLIQQYSDTNVFDMYLSGLSAELLTRACLIEGYNPAAAGRVINDLMRKKRASH